jgi:hypothetical protein
MVQHELSLKDVVLREKSQTKGKYCVILLFEVPRVIKFLEAESSGSCQGLEEVVTES